MGFTKIDSTDLVNIGVIGLPDTPGLSTGAMQAKLEETGRSVIIPKHNALIDELEASTAADYLGATPITGRASSPTVRAVMQKLSDDLGVVEAGMASAIAHDHTHSNLPLLETYTQTETDLADAVSKKHAHTNLSLLETYTQTETDLADAVSKKHAHSNKSLLDSYTQSESDLADAVSKKHSHSNKALLDTYTQTEANLADAVSKKHAHSNKTVIDALSDNGGTLEYNGSPVGGGSVNDAFKSILVGSTTLTASGEDTIEIVAGSNIVLTPDSTTNPKKVTIESTGGGTGSANWGSIGGTLSNQTDLQTALNDKATNTQTFSQASTRTNVASGDTMSTLFGKIMKWFADLKDLAFTAIDGSTTKYLRGDGTWQTFPTIPAAQVNSDWNAASGVAQILNKPTIPAAANNGQLTIQQNGTTKGTFTADQSGNTSINIETEVEVATASVSSGSITFTGIDDTTTGRYEVSFDVSSSSTNKNPYAKLTTISGEGTSNMTLVYQTDADNGTNTAHLYKLK